MEESPAKMLELPRAIVRLPHMQILRVYANIRFKQILLLKTRSENTNLPQLQGAMPKWKETNPASRCLWKERGRIRINDSKQNRRQMEVQLPCKVYPRISCPKQLQLEPVPLVTFDQDQRPWTTHSGIFKRATTTNWIRPQCNNKMIWLSRV